jgi:hypothetical protein
MSKSKPAFIHSCNVLQLAAGQRHLWQYGAAGESTALLAEDHRAPTDRLPARLVSKDWRSLWHRKLNLAWLPQDKVFLRVIQLPVSDPSELLPMVELQLEKVSPLPVAQIAWTIETMAWKTAPAPIANDDGNATPPAALQTVIVLIVARDLVESLLGDLEGMGYMADRLELPVLHQILTTPAKGDGAWVYPLLEPGKNGGLVAWWYRDTLQNLTWLQLPSTDQWPEALQEQLTQIIWAGELEGWLTSMPQWHLVADDSTLAAWEPALRQFANAPVETHKALPPRELAALSARRASRHESQANLLPREFAARYRQQFIDHLWMGGLLAIGAVYLVCLAVYFAGLQVVMYKKQQVDKEVARLSADYQDALQRKARIQVLQEQIVLKFAALDCWSATAELLPKELTLTSMVFQRGKRLLLNGQAKGDDVGKITDFNEVMSKATSTSTNAKAAPLFTKVDPPTSQGGGPGSLWSWNFSCEFNSPEIE